MVGIGIGRVDVDVDGLKFDFVDGLISLVAVDTPTPEGTNGGGSTLLPRVPRDETVDDAVDWNESEVFVRFGFGTVTQSGSGDNFENGLLGLFGFGIAPRCGG